MKVSVEIVNIENISLLGLMVGRMIERNIADAKKARAAQKVSGKVGVTAGRMEVTLEFDRNTIRIHGGLQKPLRAAIRGSLSELLQIAVGKHPIVSFLQGRVKLGGNPLFALKIMPFMRASSRRAANDE